MMTAATLQAGSTRIWSGTSGVDYDWSTAQNWGGTSGVEPLAFDRAVIRKADASAPVVTQSGEAAYTMDIAWGTTNVTGLLTLESGDLTLYSTAYSIEMGGGGNATVIQNGGTLTANGYVTVGAMSGTLTAGMSTYTKNGGTLNVAKEFTIGCKAKGTFTQNDGDVNVGLLTCIGRGNIGSYTMNGGTLNLGTSYTEFSVWNQGLAVGYGNSAGIFTGSFTQTGGTIIGNGQLKVGAGSYGNGTYTMTGGSLYLKGGYSLYIAYGGGNGTFQMGDASSTGYIGLNDPAVPSDLVVGGVKTEPSTGTLRGWGEIDLSTVYNNGKIIGDGFGTDRLLDLSQCENIYNSENTAISGWYAVNHGGVVLPSIMFNVIAGATQTWGGLDSDTLAPSGLINSVNMTFANACKGNIKGALLASDRADLPTMAGSTAKIIGVWDFAVNLDPDSASTDLSNSTLTIRYDDTLAASLGIDESALVIYQYVGGKWNALTSSVDTAGKIITANIDSFSTFVVGTMTKNQISGDANADGMVDVGDLGILAANYGITSGATWAQGDFNGDGSVDVGDLGILAANYGTGTSGADFNADYAKVFGASNVASEDTDTTSTLCSGLGLPLIAGLVLVGLMLVKLEE